ncbi:DUF937 domain-containing protein [Aminobacter sp. AP02]|uniref:DUF937 domain-containing protein n=1 Tax=Aminobacter sp. AP02 TaxID=2135737 RepID=UPI000D6D5545|nr:DUF937 domain-containing protein [Aminobacter sp. AP02]
MQSLTPDLISRIASAFGLDASATQKVASAAVPALLGGFTQVAGTPDGARKLYDAVSQQSPGILDSLTNVLGGSGQKTLEQNGLNLVSSLFGGSNTQTLASTISRFAGVDPGASSSLLGLLAPVVTGALATQANAGNLDASGLARMLSSQKSSIQAALPAGFGDLLKGSGLLGDIAGVAGQTTRAASAAAQSTTYAAQQAARATTSTASSMNWAYWVIPAALVLAAGWWMFGHRATPLVREQAGTETQQPASSETTASVPTGNMAASATQALTVLKGVPGGTEIADQTTSALDKLSSTLNGIKDAATAQTALPQLQDAHTQLDKVGGLAAQLPTAGRGALATIVAASMPTINKHLDQILAIPGVAAVLQQPVDALRSNLETLAKAPA